MNALSKNISAVDGLTVKAFRRALSRVYSVIEHRGTAPILATVLVRCDGETMSLTATDLDQDVTVTISAPGAPKLEAAIWARALRSATIGLDGPFAIRADDHRVRLTCGAASALLPTLPVADFPAMVVPRAKPDGSPISPAIITIEASDLRSALGVVRRAISTEETRYYLNGAYLHIAGEKLSLVATDGHRLFKQNVSAATIKGVLGGVIVPRDAVEWLFANLRDGAVTIAVTPTHVEVVGDGFRLLSKVIDGTFPNYNKVIPTEDGRASLSMGASAIGPLRWLSRQSDQRHASVKLVCNGAISASTRNMDSGTFETPLDGEKTGADIEIGFNGRYLIDALEAGEVSAIQFGAGALDPARIDYADPDRVGVIMPLRV